MKDVSEIICYRSVFGRNVGVLIGTIASIYIATKGIQYISKKITNKRRHSTDKILPDSEDCESNSNTNSPASSAATASNELYNISEHTNLLDLCAICQSPLNVNESGHTDVKIENIVSCSRCLSQTCKSPRCTIWLPKHDHWECSNCHHFDCIGYVRAYDWIFERLNARFDEKAAVVRITKTPPINDTVAHSQDGVMLELNDESSPIPLQQRVRVREFIEDLLASMLGSSLDHVCVGQIYKNLEYLPILERDKNPGVSYENLRKIVHTIVQEVIKLPEFYNQKGFSSVDANQVQSSFEPKIYEDLLATAVINKIVETYNDKKYENSSGIHSGGSDLDSSCHIDQINHNFTQNSRCSSTELKSEYSAFNERFRSPSMKTAEIIDEIFREKLGKEIYQSSVSASASAQSELSDYIQNHKIALPDFEFDDNGIEDEDSDEIEQEFQSIYAESTGFNTQIELSDNWLFRKAGSQNCMNGSTSSIVSGTSPVGMLVPSPTQDCPTKIGNQNADEISDLSENGSDTESLHNTNGISDADDNSDSEWLKRSTQNPYDLPHVLVESKTLIGGKNEMNSFEQSKAALIDLLEPDSLVSEQSLTGQSPAISEAKNNLILIEDRSSADGNQVTANQMDIFNMNRQINKQPESNTGADLLIKFDSLEAYNSENEPESNNVEIVTKNEKNVMNAEYEPVQRHGPEDVNRFTDEPTHNSNIDAAVVPSEDANISTIPSCSQKFATQSTEEYKDSLEFNAVNEESIHINTDDIEGELYDTVDQDSLETNKIDAIHIGDEDAKQFLPFAHIGSNWSNECPAQNSTSQSSSSTNQTVEIESTNPTNEFAEQTNSSITTKQPIEYDCQDLPGSIAEREHMKWKNAVELPNNPYSAEALQRRLSQSSSTRFTDIERLASKFETQRIETKPLGPTNKIDKPIKVVLGSNQVNSERYGRDYYINDAKSASGSRALKSSGNINLHRTVDDGEGNDNGDGDGDADDDDNYDNNNTSPENDYDVNDSLLVGDIEVVTSEEAARTSTSSVTNSVKKLQPIRVDENDPILSKATKIDHLCTEDRDYFLLESDTVTADEYAKLSLGSETTDDSHVQQLSLPHCDDSLSTTVSEESDCTVAVRVYDLNKRETKILRHDIIKRSRNPIGGDTINSLHNLGNCCSETTTKEQRSDSPLQSAIQQFNTRILENVHETRKPPRSPTKLKSVHLNRNPRKLKMADVQLMNDAFGTSLDPKIIDEIKRKNGEIQSEIEIENGAIDKDVSVATEHLLDSERNASAVRDDCQEIEGKLHSVEITISNVNGTNALVNESTNGDESNVHNNISAEDLGNIGSIENIDSIESNVTQNSESNELMPSLNQMDNKLDNQLNASIEMNDQTSTQTKTYERSYEVIVQVNEHKEKSVIEEDVLPALPSVKELARSFSTKRDSDARPEKLNRPKMVWRNSYNGSNNNDINMKDQNGNAAESTPETFVPHFNHSYHPVAPGYSITARSLSTKFREELKNVTDNNDTGRLSPERPSSPVLVPGILKNNVAFFENLRNK